VRFALTNLHLSSDAEVSFDVELDRVLNSIGWYAKEYKLSPKQVKWVFEAGLIAGANSGKLTIPPSTLECHEILVFFGIESNTLTVHGERKIEKEEKEENFVAWSGSTEASPAHSRCPVRRIRGK
jgi:hypothetical protein